MTLASRAEPIDARIVTLRGRRVMISTDLARLYGVEPRVLVQAVKRNAGRFPPDFLFQCTADETRALGSSRSQPVILKRGGNVKYPAYAFTQEGVAVLSSVLRSPQAVRVNVEIMRAFVRLRAALAEHRDLARRLDELEARYDYVSFCPELDVASQGQTVEEARSNLREAVELLLETADQSEPASSGWAICGWRRARTRSPSTRSTRG